MTTHVFRGPSVTDAEVAAILPAAHRHPPVRHGDLLALDCGPGDVVLVIDGVFHATPPVRHKEILRLLAGDVTVVGAASMGALRAAELHAYGMLGVGRIFEMYRDGVIDGDDEVAVAHTTDGSRLLTVALVDIRGHLDEAVRAGMLDPDESERLLRLARSVPYPHRHQAALEQAAAKDSTLTERAAAWWTGANGPFPGGVPRAGQKHADALTALEAVAGSPGRPGILTPPDTRAWASGPWHTPYLRSWAGRFRPRSAESGRVPFTAELQYQRLYDPDFPRRWREYVLAWVAGDEDAADPASLEARAVEVAHTRGLTRDSLSPRQLRHWLTPAETHQLDPTEQLLRLLVRSSCLGMAGHPRFAGPDGPAARLIDDRLDSATEVRTAWQTNKAMADSAPHRSVTRLRPDLLVTHLADRWEVPASDRPALDAAARDRGFSGTQSAAEAARAFYLHVSGVLATPAGGRDG